MADSQDNQVAFSGKVLVIDDDQTVRTLIASQLARLGVPEPTLLGDGEEAWKALQSERFDFIILDWKLPQLSGLALFNRIRAKAAYARVPLLVITGLLERQDFRLLQEFPCTAMLEKPFTNGAFEAQFQFLCREAVWQSQNTKMVDQLLVSLQQDHKAALNSLRQLLKEAPNPMPLALIAARRLNRVKMYKAAKGLLEAVLKVDPDSVLAMNELGKAYHLLGEHDEALSVLRAANAMSPQNIQRLCMLGEIKLNMNDPESAQAYFAKALSLDSENRPAAAGHKISSNLLQSSTEAPLLGGEAGADPQPVIRSFASLANTLGIAMVRSGSFAKGIEHYKAAMVFLRQDDDKARVAFNLGLGFLRWGKPTEALPWFQRSARAGKDTGFARSANYVQRLLAKGAVKKAARVREADLTNVPVEVPPSQAAALAKGAPDAAPAAASASPEEPKPMVGAPQTEFLGAAVAIESKDQAAAESQAKEAKRAA